MRAPPNAAADASSRRAPGVPLLVALSSLGTVLAPLNSTMVAVALPEIRHEFSLSHAAVGWLISGYLIAMAVTQPIGGRLGDQIGRARVYRGGLLAFLALSLALSFSPNFAVLVALRIAQAIAGAVLIPNGMALLRVHAPARQLGRLNGINGAVVSFAAAAGPLIGAATLAVGSWRWLFPLSVPCIAVALLLLRGLDEPPPERTARAPIDWPGTAAFVGVLIALTFQLEAVRGDGGAWMTTAGWIALAALSALFVWRQQVSASPAAEWRLFRSRSFAGATAYVLLTNLSMYTTLLMVPFFVRDVQDRGAALAGLLLGAMSVLVAVVAPISGRLADEHGRRPAALAGAAIMLGGAIMLLAGMRADVPTAYLALCLAVLGLGLGAGVGAANTAAIEAAPRSLAGSASGTSSMMRYLGSIVGAGILAGVLGEGSSAGDITTFRFVVGAVIATAALAVVAAAFIHTFPRPEFEAAEAEEPGLRSAARERAATEPA
jgi:EmrB/QacA subfamily drug resistance transporter